MNFTSTIQIVNALYKDEKNISGLIQRLRPRIAPFHLLLPLVTEHSRVLDVGCGSGLWAALMVETGRVDFVHGFDASKKAIDVADRMKSRLANDSQKRLFFEYRSVQDGLPDEQFDVVSMIDVIHHIPPKFQEQAVLDAWSRVKSGGLFLYKDMAAKPWYCGLMNRLHDLASAKEWIHFCPIEKVENIVELGNSGGRGKEGREGDNLSEDSKRASLESSGACRMFFWYQHEWRVWRKV